MADKKIRVAGVEVDLNEFARAARNNISNWMNYQGITNQEKETYLNTFNTYLDGLISGDFLLDDTGRLTGAPQSISYTGLITGNLKDGPVSALGMKRNSRNLGGNIVSFFNGLADKFREKQSRTDQTAATPLGSPSGTWSATWITDNLIKRIFGNAGVTEDTINDLWLGKEELGSDGKRSTTYRQGILNLAIADYRNKLDTGYFGTSISDEEKELQRQYILDALNGDYSKLFGPNFSSTRLMTTNGRYFQDPNGEAALAWRRQNGEPDAGYTPELLELKRKDDEAAAKAAADQAYNDEMNNAFTNLTYTGSALRDTRILPVFDTFADLTTEFLLADPFTSMWALANGAYNMGQDYSTDGRGLDISYSSWSFPLEMGHDDWMSRDNIDMRTEIPLAYIRRNELSPDEVYWSNVTDYKAGRSANAYRAKYLADYLANYFSPTLYPGRAEQLAIDSTGNNLLIDLSIDWTNLKALVYKRGNGASASIQEIDIPTLLLTVKDANPPLYETLMKSYQEFYKKGHPRSNRQGGIILKAQAGLAFKEYLGQSTTNPIDEAVRTSHEEAVAAGGVKQYNKAQRELATDFTATDWARIGTMAGDIVSAVSAFVPVYGTAVSAATGVASTLGNLAIDLNDPSVSTGEALGGLATGLALDVVGLIPGLGVSGKLGKIAKVAASLGPKILIAFTAMGAAPGATSAMKKLMSGEGNKITVGEWKDLAREISALSGATRMGRASYIRNKTFAGAKDTSVENGKFKVKTGQGEKEVTLTMEEIQAANKAGIERGNAGALEIINGSADARAKGIVATELPVGVNFKPSSIPGLSRARSTGLKENNTVVTPGSTDAYSTLNRAYRLGALRSQNPFIRFAGRHLATDFDMYQQQMNGAIIASPFRNGTGIRLPWLTGSKYWNVDDVSRPIQRQQPVVLEQTTPPRVVTPEVSVLAKPVSAVPPQEPTSLPGNRLVNLPDNAIITHPTTGVPIKVMKVNPTLNVNYPPVTAVEFEQITGTLPADFHAAYRLPDGTINWWKKGGKIEKFLHGGGIDPDTFLETDRKAWNYTPQVLTGLSLLGVTNSLETNKKILDELLNFRSPYNATYPLHTRLFDPYNIRLTSELAVSKMNQAGRLAAERSSDIQAGNAALLNAAERGNAYRVQATQQINLDLHQLQAQRDAQVITWQQLLYKDLNYNNQVSASDQKIRNGYQSTYNNAQNAVISSAINEAKGGLSRNAYNDIQTAQQKVIQEYLQRNGYDLLLSDYSLNNLAITDYVTEKKQTDPNYIFENDNSQEAVNYRNTLLNILNRINTLISFALNEASMRMPSMNNWAYGGINLIGMSNIYGNPYMQWNLGTTTPAAKKRGGRLTKSKMAEAERVKNRRHQAKIEYDVMKFINEDSRKRIQGMSGEMNTLIKKIMGA